MKCACWAAMAAVLSLLVGCSDNESGENTLSCGPGTHPENNQCVPDPLDGGGGTGGSAGGASGGSAGGQSGGSGGAAGSGGSSGDSGTGGTGPVDPSGDCPKGLPGPSLVEITAPNGTKYCIDSTEVTWKQYRAFVSAKDGDMSGQPAYCDFNTEYENVSDSPPCPKPTQSDMPAYCVDWCDAYMYCQYAGKRLCGRIGGGALTIAEAANLELSEWYNVCSNGGETAFPYGDTYDPNACATTENAAVSELPAPVNSTPDCRGTAAPYDAVYDLSGNVREWVNACTGQECIARSAGIGALGIEYETAMACDFSWVVYRIHRSRGDGFRCCADVGQ